MAQYFFRLRNGGIETDDEESLDLPDDTAAREKAMISARELLAAAVLEGRLALRERLLVEDESRRLVLSMSLGQSAGLSE
ncbi:hypothetical protein IAG41_15100 [Sphingomonas sp. JC676]|uniref:DUF6894 family protein n=1 Tax=Sphingomonas sp. JC676 TaxID=2768065 RepID=UPI00165855D3|nr:hypothetical protein [Sphingomonas sp. JC676]MBC9033721.1 hypothetical protein [Sphingomonas sp. JC676]